MPLVLTLFKAREPSDRQRESRTIETGRLTIGRGPANGWVLLDPAQHLSKIHCIVDYTISGYLLTDCSSNGVFLNGSKQRMPRDSQAVIADGDEFTLGDYLVRVSEVDQLTSRAVAFSAATPPRGAAPDLERDDPFGLDQFLAPPSAPTPPLADPFEEPPRRKEPRFDPFADPRQTARHDPFGDADDSFAPKNHPSSQPFGEPRLRVSEPRPCDPFDDGRTENPTAPRAGHAPFGNTDDDLFSGKKPDVSWQGPSQADDVDAARQAFVPPKTIPTPSMDDWDDLLGDEPPGIAETPSPILPAARPYAPSQSPPPVPQEPAIQPAPDTAQTPNVGAARLIAAFLEGAGVPTLAVPDREPEAYMRDVGALFGLMVESLRDVLISRATVKGEFGVDQTMLRSKNNNPLKFSVTAEDAIGALLQPGRPGYMPPLRATKEAYADIGAHQMAVMAGVQSALFSLLRSFDPAMLERRLQKGGMIESLLPATRRAKLWEAFCDAYKDIARDADSDFQAVFGREFARAYSEQADASGREGT